MFKTKEELNKKYSYSDRNEHYVIEACFNSFAERVEFYKTYRRDEKKLLAMKKDIWIIWNDYLYEHSPITKYYGGTYKQMYNDWLLDYCFGDVIE